jgi:hypothetical protein
MEVLKNSFGQEFNSEKIRKNFSSVILVKKKKKKRK